MHAPAGVVTGEVDHFGLEGQALPYVALLVDAEDPPYLAHEVLVHNMHAGLRDHLA